MPTFKLTYFNGRGRAETARMLFKLAGKDFEDIRIEGEKWAELKPNTPVGQVPVLEVDGTMLGQTNAINRYLAREFGFAGKTSLDQAFADMIVDTLEDSGKTLVPIFRVKDPEKKAEMQKLYCQDTLQPTFDRLQKLLENNKGGDGFFVGDDITWADLAFLNVCEMTVLGGGNPDIWDKYPKLKALKARIEGHDKIAAWISSRPETPF